MQKKRWRFVLNLIDHLPRHSAYGDALANDEDLAAQYGDEVEDGEPAAPSFAEWTPQVALLSDIADLLALIRTEVWQLAGQKSAPKFTPMPRPISAVERTEAMRRQHAREDMLAALFPARDEDEGGDD
jgi:hypothetical protein